MKPEGGTMTKALIVAVVLALTGTDAAAATQSPATVGELLDSGGKQLTGGEITRLFAGATIGGPALNQPDAKFQVKYLTNGTAAGEISSAGGSTQLTGTWSANQSNQYCQDLRTAQGMPIQGCFYYFTMGNRLFMATANGRPTPVLERQVAR